MRREGFEMTVSPPKVLIKKNDKGKKLEPIEEITVDLEEEFSSKIIDSMNRRKGKLIDLKDTGKQKEISFSCSHKRIDGLHKSIFNFNKRYRRN